MEIENYFILNSKVEFTSRDQRKGFVKYVSFYHRSKFNFLERPSLIIVELISYSSKNCLCNYEDNPCQDIHIYMYGVIFR